MFNSIDTAGQYFEVEVSMNVASISVLFIMLFRLLGRRFKSKAGLQLFNCAFWIDLAQSIDIWQNGLITTKFAIQFEVLPHINNVSVLANLRLFVII